MVQDRVHQAAQDEDAPGRLLPYGAEQRQLTEDMDSIVVPQLLRQPWRQIPGIRGQWEKQEGWDEASLGATQTWTQSEGVEGNVWMHFWLSQLG